MKILPTLKLLIIYAVVCLEQYSVRYNLAIKAGQNTIICLALWSMQMKLIEMVLAKGHL